MAFKQSADFGMAVDPSRFPRSIYNGKTYYFGSDQHKQQFDADPDKFLETLKKQ